MAGAAGAAALDRTFKNLDVATRSLATDLHSNLVLIKLIAEDMEREEEGSEQVKGLDEATLELIEAADKLERHRLALQATNRVYVPTNEPADFQRLLEAEAEKQPASAPKDHAYYKQFQEAIWNVHHSGIPMPGQEQADILITSQVGIMNKVCPLSGKPVTELQDPVRCAECRHIYEREAVMRYMGRKRECRCAAAGCPKKLTSQSLVCDPSLLMEIQELRMRGASSSHAHVADCTELDDDDDE